MSNRKDELEIFDHLDTEDTQQSQQFRRLNETAAQSSGRPNAKRALIALVIVLLLGLAIWRVIQWQNNRHEEPAATAAPTTSSAPADATPSTSASYLNGQYPQAVEGRGAADPNAVEIPPATMPEVDAKDAESVMRGFITITNSRDSAEPADFERVKEWVSPYSAIEDMSGFDAYGNDTADILPAPVTVENIEVKEATSTQPRNTSIRQSRVLETTVLASTGQKLRLEWEITAMMDENEVWKVTEASLYTWQGVSE
jgi:hypothetical protein